MNGSVLETTPRPRERRANPFRQALAWLVNTTLRILTGWICRMHAGELQRLPPAGPLILVANHINFLEVPALVTRVWPRPTTGFSKLETWHNPFKAFLFNVWEGIPLRRGEADVEAFRKAGEALKEGKIFAIAPEGTRSGDGQLQKGHPGVALLAVRSGAPLQPLVFYGHERFWQEAKRLRRVDFHVRLGRPFTIDMQGKAFSREVREQVTREIMYQLAMLLPPQNRGEYADLENATTEYLHFLPEGDQ